jgi:hypothetical protein
MRSRHELVTLTVPEGEIDLFHGDDDTGLGWASPVYGRVEPCTTIRVAATCETPSWLVAVFDLNPADPIAAVEHVPVWAEAGMIDHATAIRVARAGSSDYVLFAEPSGAEVRPRWRVAELETDARMLYGRLTRTGELTELALVDGSFVRGGGRRALGLALGRVAPALYVDSTSIRNYTPCAASPGS